NLSNVKTEIHATMFVINIATNKKLPTQGQLLTKDFDSKYATNTVPDTNVRRMPLIPNNITFTTNTSKTYITNYNSNAVFRIAYNTDGTLKEISGGTTKPYFIDLITPTDITTDDLPINIASTNAGTTSPYALTI